MTKGMRLALSNISLLSASGQVECSNNFVKHVRRTVLTVHHLMTRKYPLMTLHLMAKIETLRF